jgi:hypothetical protein
MKLISSLVRLDKDAVKNAHGKMRVVALTVAEARDHSPHQHEAIAWLGHVYVTSIEHRYNICTGQRDVS